MKKIIFLFFLILNVLFLSSCREKLNYSIFVNNDTVFNQFGTANKYLKKDIDIIEINSIDDICYGEFTIILIDDAFCDLKSNEKEELTNILYNNQKLIIVEGNSDDMNYHKINIRYNFSSESILVGKQIERKSLYITSEKEGLKNFAKSVLECKTIIQNFMEKQ